MAGTVGAILNSSLQLGSALGVAIATIIQQEVEAKRTGTDYQSRYAGCQAGFIFYAALMLLSAIMTFIFYKPNSRVTHLDENKGEDSPTFGRDDIELS